VRVDNNVVTGNAYTNTAGDSFEAVGILVFGQSNKVTVDHNLVINNQDGIALASTSNAQVSHNFMSANAADGILLLDSFQCAIQDNLSAFNGRNGIQLNGIFANGAGSLSTAHDNLVDGNYCFGNGNDGILLAHADNNRITNNAAIVNVVYGIAVLPGDDG